MPSLIVCTRVRGCFPGWCFCLNWITLKFKVGVSRARKKNHERMWGIMAASSVYYCPLSQLIQGLLLSVKSFSCYSTPFFSSFSQSRHGCRLEKTPNVSISSLQALRVMMRKTFIVLYDMRNVISTSFKTSGKIF